MRASCSLLRTLDGGEPDESRSSTVVRIDSIRVIRLLGPPGSAANPGKLNNAVAISAKAAWQPILCIVYPRQAERESRTIARDAFSLAGAPTGISRAISPASEQSGSSLIVSPPPDVPLPTMTGCELDG